ncbi:MAG: peptidase C39 [Oscillibacter sp.]|nr:peptidase C39 [Oscillibacter sp.]
MKIPLRYQMTEYDCGPTSLLNALSFLFEREEIPPEVVRNIMLFCLDSYGADGFSGKNGTSHTAMQFLSHWLDGFGQTGRLALSSAYLSGREVELGQNSRLRDALLRGGAAVVRVDLDGWHYILLTEIHGGDVYAFDPYRIEGACPVEGVRTTDAFPERYNRVIPARLLEQETVRPYAFGPTETREAVTLFNGKTALTADKTVEYMI